MGEQLGNMSAGFRNATRVGWRHVDPAGVIHFTSIFRFFEEAEFEFYRSLGLDLHDLHPGLPRVRCEAEYLEPIVFDDLVYTYVSVQRVGRSSFTLNFIVRRDGMTVAKGATTIVHINRQDGRPMPLEAHGSLRHQLLAYANNS